MTTRLLPRDEWPKLAGTELEAVWPHLPLGAHVVVVEEGEALVGCWALFPQVHAEGVWIAPSHRGKASVARRLLAGMRRTAQAMGAQSVATGALTDDVRRLLDGLRAVKLPGDHYAVPITRD